MIMRMMQYDWKVVWTIWMSIILISVISKTSHKTMAIGLKLQTALGKLNNHNLTGNWF